MVLLDATTPVAPSEECQAAADVSHEDSDMQRPALDRGRCAALEHQQSASDDSLAKSEG